MSLQKNEGSVFGGILLVAGSCIGAGMLALPVVTSLAGFFPSFVMFLIAWLFMTATGFVLLEVNIALGYEVSLISMAEKTLGVWGRFLCWLLFIFLFYSLGVAYVAASGSILHDIVYQISGFQLPASLGSTLFTVGFGIIIYFGTKPVDYINRVLMIGLIIAYIILVMLGSQHIQSKLLQAHEWAYSVISIPILIVSFGFHNMIPSLSHYLRGDIKRLRLVILFGSLIPLIIYLLWEAVILGIVPVEGREGLLNALDKGESATHVLNQVINSPLIIISAQAFALFAIITSFLAQSLSLVDFLADGLKISKQGINRVLLLAFSLVPSFGLAFMFPHIFIAALNFAGGVCAVLLFGIFPVAMLYILKRRHKGLSNTFFTNKTVLGLIFFCAIAVFALEILQEAGVGLTPKNDVVGIEDVAS